MVLFLGTGCGGGGDGDPDVIAKHPISGQLAPGRTWTYMTGEARLSVDATRYFITLYPASFTPCIDPPPDATAYDDTVGIVVPPAVGTYEVGTSADLAGAGFSGADNINATGGFVVIDTITATTISGGANISGGTGGTVHPHADGTFQATICQ